MFEIRRKYVTVALTLYIIDQRRRIINNDNDDFPRSSSTHQEQKNIEHEILKYDDNSRTHSTHCF